nr:hypothetical protein [Tanacetum cinerariifolium]
MAFVSSPSLNSTNEVPTDFGVSTQVSIANLSDATVYDFLANQPNGSQLVHEDLEQTHKDDLEETDLKWQLALLSMRAKRFFQKTGKKITINGSDTTSYDKAKVEYFNCYKMGHFARECKVPRNQENRIRNQETITMTMNVEDISSKAMVTQRDIKIKDSKIVVLKRKLERISNEKDVLETKIEKFENASQSLVKLIRSQVTDYSKRGLGYVSYNAIPPPHTRSYGVKPIEVVTQKSSVKIFAPIKENNGAPLIEDWESDEEDEVESPPEKEQKTVEPSVDKVEADTPKQNDKPARRLLKYAEMYRTQRPRVPKAMLARTGLKSVNYVRPVNSKRNFQRKAAYNNRNFFKNVNTAKGKVNTARPNLAVLNVVRTNKGKDIEDQGYFDSGCSRHMTGNISYLTNFKEFDRGTNEVDTANIQVSVVSTPVSTVSTQYNTANLSDATVSPRNQESRPRNQDSSRKTMNVEDTSSKAMVATDGACFDWTYMADDEAPTNLAFMAFSDSEYKDVTTLFTAIETRFDGIEATKKTQKTLLKQLYKNFSATSIESLDLIFNRLQKIVSQLAILGVLFSLKDLNLKFLRSLPSEWNTHVVVWRNKSDLDTMSLDDLYNNFKIVKQEVRGTTSTNTSSQNMAFVSSLSLNSTNEVPTDFGVSTASTQKTGKKITINGSDTTGYDKAKVEYFNCYKMGHFARECKVPRNQENRIRNQETITRTMNVEDTSSKAMVVIDEADFDWSYMADDEAPTNMAFMALSDSKPIEVVTQNSSVKISAPIKENNGAPLIEDWESDEEDEVESPLEKEQKTVEPSVDKVEADTSKQNDKPARRLLKYAEMYRTQRPRGNQRNWNNLKSHQLGNISYLTDFKEFDGGYVAFGGGSKGGKITGKGTIKTGQSSMETGPSQDYILMPLWNNGSLFNSSLKDSDGDNQDNNGPSTKSEIDNQKSPNGKNNTKDINTVEPSINTASSNINTASPIVNTVRLSDDFFGVDNDIKSFDGVELDISNISITYLVPTTLNTRINKDHSLDNVIGDIQSGVQTRRMIVTTNEQGFINAIYEEKTHVDLHTCLFACFLSQKEPKMITNALKDPTWVEAMQEELLQFHLQKMDVKSAFLYQRIEEEVYVCKPLGFEDPDYPDKVYKVEKALYGLHQAPRACYEPWPRDGEASRSLEMLP